jgi:hypothetical protein
MPTAPPSIAISEIRGKIGQWVYARDAGGPLRRPWKEHRSMSSAAQDAQRLIYQAVYPRWSATLTEAQRQAWRKFTDGYPRKDQLGQGYCPSGQSRFNGCNSISWKYAAAWLDDPPADLHCHQPTAIEILTATETPQALSIRMYGTLDPDEYWVLSATPLTNIGVLNVTRLWRPLDFASDALPFTYDAIVQYTAKFEALVAGQKVHARLQIANVATGTISVGLSTSLAVSA